MKIPNAQQIRNWDAYTITHEPISSIDLMERAAGECVKWLGANVAKEKNMLIFCGKGNNGGDGLAIARMLCGNGFTISVFINEEQRKWSDDAFVNVERLKQTGIVCKLLKEDESLPVISADVVVIDALFGSGLNRPIAGFDEKLVKYINTSGAKIISIDLPSGMLTDSSSINYTIVKAGTTLSFQVMKHCFLIPENASFVGELVVLDIGLDKNYIDTLETGLQLITATQIAALIKTRDAFAHKGSFGHALLIAGSDGKAGAAVLAAKACLRTGPGLLTVNLPKELSVVMNTTLPEAMTTTRASAIEFEKYASIGIGPGIGVDDDAGKILTQALDSFEKPMVIDADALTILSRNKTWMKKIPAGSILTPHPKEFDRLFGESANDFDRVAKAIAFSKQYPLVLILKGHHTLIAFDGKGWYNTTGNAGLAKGGSGDVLTGMLTALLAQKYLPLNAALLGVYLHGLSADIALFQTPMESMLASDVIDNIGAAFRQLQDAKR